jgi:hypothetical protein
MELYYLAYFIDHLLSFDKTCLSSSNAMKWEAR